MSSNVSYRVKLKDVAEEIHIDADDVNLDCPCGEFAGEEGVTCPPSCDHERAWFNFTKGENDPPHTVAALPYNQVVYIID